MASRARVLFITMGSRNKSSFVARLGWLAEHPDFAFDVTGVASWSYKSTQKQRQQDFDRIVSATSAADIVVLHRVVFNKAYRERFFSCCKPVIYDYDDALYAVPSAAYHTEMYHPLGWGKRIARCLLRGRSDYALRYKSLVEMLRHVDAVSAGNPHLAQFASHHCKNVMVVPTVVDVAHFPVKVNGQPSCVTVGWYGSPDNHWYIDTVLEALRELSEKFGDGVRFEVISSEEFTASKLHVHWTPWNPERELDDLLDFDIGIMPLTDDEWARGKSGNKAIYYMALGIPAVVSPVGVNREVIVDGVTGLYARNRREWVAALTSMVESAEMRREMGQNARKRVMQYYSREVAAKKLSLLLNSVTANSTQRASVL